MAATIIPFTSATTLFEAAEKRNPALTAGRTKRSRVSSLDEPEARLWKVCARQTSRREATIEVLVVAVFFLIALALIAGCVVELQQLLQTDAIGQAATKALQR
jgi:hypothetical protein